MPPFLFAVAMLLWAGVTLLIDSRTRPEKRSLGDRLGWFKDRGQVAEEVERWLRNQDF